MFFNKYKRTNFLVEVENEMNVKEWDMLLSGWDLFEIKNPLQFDNVKAGEVQRPDLLSFRIYGDSMYWWVLCKFNQIDDLWNDMYVGMDLIIPSKSDIEDYYSNVRRRARNNE